LFTVNIALNQKVLIHSGPQNNGVPVTPDANILWTAGIPNLGPTSMVQGPETQDLLFVPSAQGSEIITITDSTGAITAQVQVNVGPALPVPVTAFVPSADPPTFQ
jgi:hypothetical protein